MSKGSLNEAIDYVLSQAKQQGAEADVVVTKSRHLSLKANQGQLEEHKVSSGQVLGIRLIKDARVASSYSESFEKASLDTMLNNALQSVRYSKQDEHQSICCIDSVITTDLAEIAQEDNASIDEKMALALELEQGVIERPYVSGSPYNGYSDGEVQHIIANTKGTYCQQIERSFQCYAYALLEKEGKQSMAGKSSLARRFDQLQASECIKHGYQLAYDLMDGEPIKTGQYSVIFNINALSQLFGAFGSAFSGVSAMKGTTPLAEKVGKRIASGCLTLRDMAYVEGGMAISTFDSEGFAKKDNVLIAGGELNTLLHNSQTARYCSATPTASAARGAKSTLDVAANHKMIDLGTMSNKEVQSGTYLELVELQGVHAGADAISGDFSFGASGFLCREGERVQAVRGITVAGNFYAMLEQIEALGNVLQINDGRTFYAPLIRFDGLSIGGK